MFSIPCDVASAGRGNVWHWSARVRSAGRNAASEASDDDGGAFDRGEVAAQAGDVRRHPVGRAHVHEDDVIVGVMDHAVEQGDQFGMALPVEPALEDGELNPLAIAFHDPENPPPAFRVADVVGHDV